MMARLTIEDCWWTDPRRSKLIKAIGDDDLADVVAIRAWRLAQEFWKHARGLVPKSIFQHLRNAQDLIHAGLAEDLGDEVYVRGSSAYLDWLIERQESGRVGGKKSAQRPRDARGRLLPDNDPSGIQAAAKRDPSESKPLTLTLSLKKENTVSQEFANANPVSASDGSRVLEKLQDPFTDPLVSQVSKAVQEGWLATYPDPAWLKLELKKAVNYTRANPRKTPKSPRGWSAFLTSWLNRAWEYQRRRETGSNKAAPNSTPVDITAL
jgi:hypothetical protein